MSRLVLTRRTNETVVLHDGNKVIAEILVARIDRNQVRLSFDADKAVKIDRQEVYETKKAV